MSSDVLLSLGQIPTIKLDSWKTINPDGTRCVSLFVLASLFLQPCTSFTASWWCAILAPWWRQTRGSKPSLSWRLRSGPRGSFSCVSRLP
jgi:hypothetical protein